MAMVPSPITRDVTPGRVIQPRSKTNELEGQRGQTPPTLPSIVVRIEQ